MRKAWGLQEQGHVQGAPIHPRFMSSWTQIRIFGAVQAAPWKDPHTPLDLASSQAIPPAAALTDTALNLMPLKQLRTASPRSSVVQRKLCSNVCLLPPLCARSTLEPRSLVRGCGDPVGPAP